MTSIDLNSMNPEQRHIETLRQHGARIKTPDGSVELNSYFYYNAIDRCIADGLNAIAYDMILPDIDEPMMIAIWKDGHVDSGSVKGICDCLAAR